MQVKSLQLEVTETAFFMQFGIYSENSHFTSILAQKSTCKSLQLQVEKNVFKRLSEGMKQKSTFLVLFGSNVQFEDFPAVKSKHCSSDKIVTYKREIDNLCPFSLKWKVSSISKLSFRGN